MVLERKRAPMDKKRFISFWLIRILLLVLLGLELSSNRTTFQFIYFIIFLLSFVPSILKRTLSISLPIPFEILYLISLLTTVLGEKIFSGILVQFILGIFFGIFGFLLMYTLYYNTRLQSSKILITLFSFSFAVAGGAVWIVFLFLLSQINIWTEPLTGTYIPIALTVTILGAGIVSITEYFYLHYGEGTILQSLLNAFMKKIPTCSLTMIHHLSM